MQGAVQPKVSPGSAAVPELVGLCNLIHNRIQELEGCSREINSAIWRLISPRPVNAVGDENKPGVPEPNTLEASLRAVLRRLEALNGDLSEHCKNLDGAV